MSKYPVISIDEKYTLRADGYQWIVFVIADGNKSKRGRNTYHATLKQACAWIIDDSIKRCDSIESLKAKIDETMQLLMDGINAAHWQQFVEGRDYEEVLKERVRAMGRATEKVLQEEYEKAQKEAVK